MGLIQKAEQISGFGETAARASIVLGSSTELLGKSFSDYLADVKAKNPVTVKDGVGTLIGAAAGYYYGKKKYHHPVLGALMGGSLGRNVPALLDAGTRRDALWNIGGTGAAVLVARTYKGWKSAAAFIGVEAVSGIIKNWL